MPVWRDVSSDDDAEVPQLIIPIELDEHTTFVEILWMGGFQSHSGFPRASGPIALEPQLGAVCPHEPLPLAPKWPLQGWGARSRGRFRRRSPPLSRSSNLRSDLQGALLSSSDDPLLVPESLRDLP